MAATLYGANRTLENNVPIDMIDPTYRGKVNYIVETITFAAELAVGDKIYIGKLPKGARLIDFDSTAPVDAASGMYKIGWDASADAVEAADDDGISVAADQDFGAAALVRNRMKATIAGWLKKFEAEVELVATVTEVSTNTTGKTHKFVAQYLMGN
jgi:hypothetical protein